MISRWSAHAPVVGLALALCLSAAAAANADPIVVTAADVDALETGQMMEVPLADGIVINTIIEDGVFVDLNRVNLVRSDGRFLNLYGVAVGDPGWNVFRRSGEVVLAENVDLLTQFTAEERALLEQYGRYSVAIDGVNWNCRHTAAQLYVCGVDP
ncbi:MAG: hypothetical protein KC466_19750 [Myxococcales bacterium]|nr:hypothetical protein [Myxococcales bacterium]